MTKIAILNESTVLQDADVQTAVYALQKQITRDFAPIWPQAEGAKLNFHPSKIAPPDAWVVHILDNSDQAGALGYHDLKNDGTEALVFVKSDMDAGMSWTVTLSHELLEMIVDPLASLSALNTAGSKEYAFEVCDACEDDRYAYEINGVKVSDFVYPAWFEDDRAGGSTKFDFGGYLQSPMPTLLPGGYIGWLDLSNPSAGWQQETRDRAPLRESQRFRRRQKQSRA